MLRQATQICALVIALGAGTANADEATGAVSDINKTANTFMLDGKTYTAGENNVVGSKVTDLMEGDKVKVTFSNRDTLSGKSPINVMSIEKAE